MVLGAPLASNPLTPCEKRRGGSIPLAPPKNRYSNFPESFYITVGVAGHVDHGKTSLVRILNKK